ncbi:MAG: BMP family protein [Deltaproteobacteria bacterium]|nr:BMP family protein [Deltaproteobacteria bacterium]
MSRRLARLVAAVVAVGSIGACTSGGSTGGFKVALLSPGPISDAGWNAAAYEGLLAVRDRLGAEISQVETRTPSEFEQAYRDYARRGFRLVIGHGFEFQDAAAKVAPEFPNTVFLTTSGSTVRPNVAPIVFRLEEATFVLGELAARMAPDGAACAVGGMEIPSVKSTFIAFQAGAAHAKPGYPVPTSYLGNWDDVGAARTATLALIDRGCRFVLQNADAAGPGVFQAAGERGIYAFGSNRAQHEVAPNVVLASAVIDIPAAFVAIAREVKDGTFKSRIIEEHMADGAVAVVFNPALEGKIPADVRNALLRTEAAIRAGELKVPTAAF